MMSYRLDEQSKETLGRFAIKIVISIVLGSFGQIGRAVGTDGWFALYAAFSVLYAILRGDRVPLRDASTRSFNHWDEALWLITAAAGTHILMKALA